MSTGVQASTRAREPSMFCYATASIAKNPCANPVSAPTVLEKQWLTERLSDSAPD